MKRSSGASKQRSELAELRRAIEAHNHAHLSRGIMGAHPGSKLQAAESFNVGVWSEEQLRAALGET